MNKFFNLIQAKLNIFIKLIYNYNNQSELTNTFSIETTIS